MTIYFVTTDDTNDILESFEDYTESLNEAQALQHNLDLDLPEDVHLYEITIRKIPTPINIEIKETLPFKDKQG